MKVDYPHSANISDFELTLINKFRKMLAHGYGSIEVKIHEGKLRICNTTESVCIKEFQESK